MSKEIEDLDCVIRKEKTNYGVCYLYSRKVVEEFRQALKRLEAIDNAKPSEAMECLDNLENSLSLANELLRVTDTSAMDNYITTIKQYILKSQEQEKVLSIVKEKNVDLGMVDFFNNVEDYNEWLTLQPNESRKPLSEYEFDTVKRWPK